MAFTTEIKDEICTLEKNKLENIAELSAFVRNNGLKTKKGIQLITENPKVARRVFSLFKEIYNVTCVIENGKSPNLTKKRYYLIKITDKVELILKNLAILNMDNNKTYIPIKYIIDTEEERRAYLRGCFLATGSINNPKTASYHLEMSISNKKEANNILEILKTFDIQSNIITRDKGYMLYVKRAEKIADFLRIIEANRAVLYFEDIRIYRDHKNMTNRLNNCEQANVEKIITACNKQLSDINYITKTYTRDMIDEKIYEAMTYRQKYPEVSLNELSQIITQETGVFITKSGLNHRFRKIAEIADKIKNKE